MQLTRAWMACALVAAAGCETSSDDPEDALVRQRCPVGDLSAPPEMEILYRDFDRSLATGADGSRVPMFVPPQGGHVAYVGARARNLDCRVIITSSLTDPCDGSVITLESRPATLVMDGAWAGPELPAEDFNIGNLPTCPLAGLRRDVHGQPYVLTIKVEDHDGRTVESSATIVPTCPPGETGCLCDCRRDYVLGTACTGDAGVDAATVPACDAGPADAQ